MYKVHVLDVGDADAIIVKYAKNENSPCVTVLIDAGNLEDGEKIKNKLDKINGKFVINYAFCTHPDKDHKGGFFELLEDRSVVIEKFCLMDPWEYVDLDDFPRIKNEDSAKKKARACWNHPKDSSKNLIDIAISKKIFCSISENSYCDDIPLKVLGPSNNFYREIALGMISNFAEIEDSPETDLYDELAEVSEKNAKSIIDEDDDSSYTNMSSLILLFQPKNDKKFLFTGDSCCSGIFDAITNTDIDLSNCMLKVPHHGSKHNLNTEIIEMLEPESAVISAKGSRKHPSSGIVYWLSKYCNVYSTHKSGDLMYTSEKVEYPASPLKKRIK